MKTNNSETLVTVQKRGEEDVQVLIFLIARKYWVSLGWRRRALHSRGVGRGDGGVRSRPARALASSADPITRRPGTQQQQPPTFS